MATVPSSIKPGVANTELQPGIVNAPMTISVLNSQSPAMTTNRVNTAFSSQVIVPSCLYSSLNSWRFGSVMPLPMNIWTRSTHVRPRKTAARGRPTMGRRSREIRERRESRAAAGVSQAPTVPGSGTKRSRYSLWKWLLVPALGAIVAGAFFVLRPTAEPLPRREVPEPDLAWVPAPVAAALSDARNRVLADIDSDTRGMRTSTPANWSLYRFSVRSVRR